MLHSVSSHPFPLQVWDLLEGTDPPCLAAVLDFLTVETQWCADVVYTQIFSPSMQSGYGHGAFTKTMLQTREWLSE